MAGKVTSFSQKTVDFFIPTSAWNTETSLIVLMTDLMIFNT